MLLLILALIWLFLALAFAYFISYSHKIKNAIRVGFGMILGSFFIGIVILIVAIKLI